MIPLQEILVMASDITWYTWLMILLSGIVVSFMLLYIAITAVAPFPRPPLAQETTFRTIDSDGNTTDPKQLPCWQDVYLARKSLGQHLDKETQEPILEPPEVFMSVVIPAYNEQDRLEAMLSDAVTFLDSAYSTNNNTNPTPSSQQNGTPNTTKARKRNKPSSPHPNGTSSSTSTTDTLPTTGYEILLVSDGSTDSTCTTALSFAQSHPSTPIRVISLLHNRGKGGAVTHGLRHVRGRHAVFADADGATRFSCLAALVTAADTHSDAHGRCVAVGSRAHYVSSPEVVRRSFLRNALMHSFHLLLRLLTPPATSRIKDTQCGFKLFTRAALPFIIPHMHSEGWIFDVEMLMLAEKARVPMVEVPVEWREVKGSKLNVLLDSLGMAWGLAVLRGAWGWGVYRI